MTLAAAAELRVPFAEKVAITAAPGHTGFDAYGRRFALTLENNSRLLTALPAAQKAGVADAQLLRGTVDGVAGSWVRLARVGGGLEGAIWDGHDLYVVTRHANIAAHLGVPLAAGPEDTVVYRLSDARDGLPAQFCGLEAQLPRSPASDSPSALKQYTGMVADLRAAAISNPTDQLDISLIADAEFQAKYGAATRDTMLARLNTVDGIFSEQVGVTLAPATIRLVTGTNPLTATDAQTLLGDLGDYRSANEDLRSAGVTHLMTGKDLAGDTAGIAFLDSLCDRHEGVSLSYSMAGEFYGALIMAHELGHNFGARHDGAAGSACESVPSNYLMWPSVTGSSQFSQCSLDAIRPVVQRARVNACIKPAFYSDVAVSLPASPMTVDTLAEFSLPVTVRSAGTIAAAHARASIELPASLAFRSATVTGGTCALSGQSVDCDLGDLAAGQSRLIDLRLMSSETGSFSVHAEATADADRYENDNDATVVIGLQSAVDLSVSLTATDAPVFVNDIVDYVIDVASTRSQAARGGKLAFYHPGFSITSLDVGAHACAQGASDWDPLVCQLADVAGGTTTRLVVHARAFQAGDFNANATVSVTGDGEYRNNSARRSMDVLAEREVKSGVSLEYLNAVIGASYDVTYTLTAAGRLPSDNVTFTLFAPFTGTIDSIAPSAGTCVAATAQKYDCKFGALSPGDVRTVAVRLRMNAAGNTSMDGSTRYFDGPVQRQFSTHTWIYASQRVDVAAELPGMTTFEEGQTSSESFYVRSLGIEPAQNIVATLEVPAPVRITRLFVTPASSAAFQCSVLTPQTARCTGSFAASAPGDSVYFAYEVTSDTATAGSEQLTVSATDDGDATNDVMQRPITVRQGYDVVLSGDDELLLDVNGTGSVELTATTGHNPVAGVVIVPDRTSRLVVESIRANGVECALVAGGCPLGDLPAHASVPVSIRFRANAEGEGSFYVRANAAYDSIYANNVVAVHYVATQPTDVKLTVQPSIETVANGSAATALPTISVSSVATARDVVVNVPLPTFTTLESVSASNGGVCSGTTTLECDFATIPAGSQAGITIYLSAPVAGKFDSRITMTARNDSTPDNNAATLAVNVVASATSDVGSGASAGSAKSSGGGRIEWLVLACLGLLALRRVRRARTR